MSFSLELSHDAQRYLRRMDRRTQERIAEALHLLREDPFHAGTKPLSGLPGRRSARVGGWRIVYRPDVDRQHLEVSDIGPRGQVYRNL